GKWGYTIYKFLASELANNAPNLSHATRLVVDSATINWADSGVLYPLDVDDYFLVGNVSNQQGPPQMGQMVSARIKQGVPTMKLGARLFDGVFDTSMTPIGANLHTSGVAGSMMNATAFEEDFDLTTAVPGTPTMSQSNLFLGAKLWKGKYAAGFFEGDLSTIT